ncbi:MAG: outer membrane beta-barrel protein [Candidatus Eisenbacteria bacterium]
MFTFRARRSGHRTTPEVVAAVTLFLLSVLAAGAAAENPEDEKGFYLGLKLMGSSLHADNTTDADEVLYIKDDGGGVQLDFGYRFNRTFMLEFCVGGANHETSDPAIDARFEVFQIFGYYRFSPERAFRPYLKGGFGGYGLYVEEGPVNWRIKGGGVALGGGFRYFFAPYFCMGLDFTHNIIQYDTAAMEVEGFSYEWAIDEHGAMTSLGVTFGYSF